MRIQQPSRARRGCRLIFPYRRLAAGKDVKVEQKIGNRMRGAGGNSAVICGGRGESADCVLRHWVGAMALEAGVAVASPTECFCYG